MTDLAADAAAAPSGVIATDDERYNATLLAREDKHESLVYFWVKFDAEPTPFVPGQYMTIGVFVDEQDRAAALLGRIGSRAWPATTGYEFYVRLVQRRHVHAAAVAAARRPPDADDRAEGQVHPRARRRSDAPLHLVRHGQRAVRVDDASMPCATGGPRKAVFLNGVSYVADLGYRDLLEGWAASGDYPVTYVPTVSRPDDPANAGWSGRTGRVEASSRRSSTISA